jgi:hypothetical protein
LSAPVGSEPSVSSEKGGSVKDKDKHEREGGVNSSPQAASAAASSRDVLAVPPLGVGSAGFGSGVSASALAAQHRHAEFFHHRLRSPFASLEELRPPLSSRHPHPFFHPASVVAPQEWMMGLRLGHNPGHVSQLANGSEERGCSSSPDVGSVSPCRSDVSSRSCRNSSPQTEALDLHTKKEDRGKTTICILNLGT